NETEVAHEHLNKAVTFINKKIIFFCCRQSSDRPESSLRLANGAFEFLDVLHFYLDRKRSVLVIVEIATDIIIGSEDRIVKAHSKRGSFRIQSTYYTEGNVVNLYHFFHGSLQVLSE